MEPVLSVGKNCWRLEHADRVSFIIDADSYYRAFRSAVIKAQKSIYIIAWDIDSRFSLLREDPKDEYPIILGDLLNHLTQKKSDLEVHILLWDFDRLFGHDREWFPLYKLDWRMHHNIHLQMDNKHPLGGCHHEKVVVVDDQIAFCGGLDLTKARWDTQEHSPDDVRRITPDNTFYRPHHDVQMLVSGDIALALGEFFRQRWQLAAVEEIQPPTVSNEDLPWPDDIKSDAEDCHVAIVRTQPECEYTEEIREIEQLYLDAIASAEKTIYIENQYLTSFKIKEALMESLRNDNGPEIVIVLPYSTEGWLSQSTMDVFRARLINELRQADLKGRLGIFYAHQDGLTNEESIKVHAKMMICDNDFVRIGSANLNNRSMGFDTECDLAMEASNRDDLQESIANLRSRLLAEHLDVDLDEITQLVSKNPSILGLISHFNNGPKKLKKLEIDMPYIASKLQEQQDIFDPEKPIEPEKFFQKLFGDRADEHGKFPLIGFIGIIAVFLLFAAVWRFTALHDFITEERLTRFINFMQQSRFGLFYSSAAFVLGGLVSAPVTVLISLALIIFGSVKGLLYALIGSVLSAAVTYQIGLVLGRDFARRFAGKKVNLVSKRLGKQGILSTAIIRMVPIAPFSIINIIAGASHIRFKDFITGTILGMLPGTLALAGIIDRGMAVIANPDWKTVGYLALILLLISIAGFLLWNWLQKQDS